MDEKTSIDNIRVIGLFLTPDDEDVNRRVIEAVKKLKSWYEIGIEETKGRKFFTEYSNMPLPVLIQRPKPYEYKWRR